MKFESSKLESAIPKPPRLDAKLMVGTDSLPGLAPSRQSPAISPWRACIAKARDEKSPVAIFDEMRTPNHRNEANEESMEDEKQHVDQRHDDGTAISAGDRDAELELTRLALSAAHATAEAAQRERVEEQERLEATIRAIGEQLVAAHRERDVAASSAAREAALAAQSRVAHAASFDALQQECIAKLVTSRAEAKKSRDDLIHKAQRQFAQARDQYAAVYAESNAHADAARAAKAQLTQLTMALDNFKAQTKTLRTDLQNEVTQKNELAAKLDLAQAENARLKAEVDELRKISEELASIAERNSKTSPDEPTRSSHQIAAYLDTPAAVRALRL